MIDLDADVKYKKEFTSFLNKLTDINKEIIYNKITVFIKPFDEIKLNTLFEILINFIKLSSNIIYIDVLYLFPENFVNNQINNYTNNYLNKNEWIPNETFIIDNKILYNNDNYDNYCKFIKNNLSNTIDIYIQKNEYKHITEFLLDQLLIILENITDNKIIDKIKSYELEGLDYSTKFKLMKITEKY